MILSRDEIKYSGRFDFSNENKVDFGWSKTSLSINFIGNKVYADIESDGEDYFLVVLDGKIYNNAFPVRERKLYKLVEDIGYGEHSLELVKRTETFVGTASFYGFEIFNGKILEPSKDKELKIEIFGDSISCGYGNESENELGEFNSKDENSYLSYGAIAARELNAELNITSWGGLGLVRNYDDSPMPLPERIEWITNKDTNKKWDFSSYVPNIVVINLGTNDFNEHPPTKDNFVNGYRILIDRIKNYYGKVKIICAIGPVMEGKVLDDIRDYVKNHVVDYYNSINDKDIFFLEHSHQKAENGYGQGYHPSQKTHYIMADELVNKIKEIL